MSAVIRPNIHIKKTGGNLQESYLVKKQRQDRKRLLESKDLTDKIHPESEEYNSPITSLDLSLKV